MPIVRDYPQATSLMDTDAFLLDRLGIGTMYIEAQDAFEGAYDIAMGFPGQPPVSSVILAFVAVRPFTIQAVGDPSPPFVASQAVAINPPSGGSVTLAVAKNGAGQGTITWAAGVGVAAITWPTDTPFVAGDLLTVSTPANVFSMSDITMTLAGLR